MAMTMGREGMGRGGSGGEVKGVEGRGGEGRGGEGSGAKDEMCNCSHFAEGTKSRKVEKLKNIIPQRIKKIEK